MKKLYYLLLFATFSVAPSAILGLG